MMSNLHAEEQEILTAGIVPRCLKCADMSVASTIVTIVALASVRSERDRPENRSWCRRRMTCVREYSQGNMENIPGNEINQLECKANLAVRNSMLHAQHLDQKIE